ncbi:MAG: hypothetical protein JWQ66_3104 [Mucilaginibacter sp.]|nr:hypothetical protein [Mucilaginibacter sp.]
MEKMFTKLTGSILLLVLLLVGFNVKAQTTLASNVTLGKKTTAKADSSATAAAITKPASTTETKPAAKPAEDTTWKPQRRLWGYAFGDAYFDQHSPAVTSTLGKENNYYQTPSNRNAFQFRRIYLGYDYDITKKFKAEVLLASEPTENTTPTSATSSVVNGDNTADGKLSFYIKNFNLRARDVWNGTDFVIGEMSTPGFALNEGGTNAPTSLSEATWGYRSIERTITDFHKNNSFDVGAALQGTFDPKTKNFGYVLMVGDNTQASVTTVYNPNSALSNANPNPNTGFFKIFYGDLWGKFFDQHLYLDLYADYAKTSSTLTSAAVTAGNIGAQEHNMYKAFAAYTTPILTVGVEAYTQTLDNAVVNNTTKTAEKATVNALSVWVRGAIVKNKWGYFARFDSYNPDTKFNSGNAYAAPLTNYGSYDPTVKEQFYTFGLDYTPAKNVHFMPNVWLTRYKDQYAATTAGYQPDNHTLVYRMTFFYTFGK